MKGHGASLDRWSPPNDTLVYFIMTAPNALVRAREAEKVANESECDHHLYLRCSEPEDRRQVVEEPDRDLGRSASQRHIASDSLA